VGRGPVPERILFACLARAIGLLGQSEEKTKTDKYRIGYHSRRQSRTLRYSKGDVKIVDQLGEKIVDITQSMSS